MCLKIKNSNKDHKNCNEKGTRNLWKKQKGKHLPNQQFFIRRVTKWSLQTCKYEFANSTETCATTGWKILSGFFWEKQRSFLCSIGHIRGLPRIPFPPHRVRSPHKNKGKTALGAHSGLCAGPTLESRSHGHSAGSWALSTLSAGLTQLLASMTWLKIAAIHIHICHIGDLVCPKRPKSWLKLAAHMNIFAISVTWHVSQRPMT